MTYNKWELFSINVTLLTQCYLQVSLWAILVYLIILPFIICFIDKKLITLFQFV